MRNYRRYYFAKLQFQIEIPPGSGNWVDGSLTYTIGRTPSELEDIIAADVALLDPNTRYQPITRLGPFYFLLDNAEMYELAIANVVVNGPQSPMWQPPPSPRKTWSGGK